MNRPGTRPFHGAAVVLVASIFLVACSGDSTGGVTLINDTSEAVRITEVISGVEGPSQSRLDDGRDTLRAGERNRFILDSAGESQCTSGEIVARTVDGREVARLLPPVCAGAEIALTWAIDSELARLLPGTIADSPTRRYTLNGMSAEAGQSGACSPCGLFTAAEIDQTALAAGVTVEDLTFGLADWTSKTGDESVLIRAIKAPAAETDLLTAWIAVDKSNRSKTELVTRTIGGKLVTVLSDRTRPTEWFATSYAYSSHGLLFIVSYSDKGVEPTTDGSTPALVDTVVRSLP